MRRYGMTANETNVHQIPATVGHIKAFNNKQNPTALSDRPNNNKCKTI